MVHLRIYWHTNGPTILRARALIITKLDEARLWATKAMALEE